MQSIINLAIDCFIYGIYITLALMVIGAVAEISFITFKVGKRMIKAFVAVNFQPVNEQSK